jgi:hypothetical protein
MSVQRFSGQPLPGRWVASIAVLAWLVLAPVAAAGEGDETAVATPVAPGPDCRAADPAASRTPLAWIRQAVLDATTPTERAGPAASPKGRFEVLNGRGYNYAESSRSPSAPLTPGRVTLPATP